MGNLGQDVIDIGKTRVGQKYVWGARVPLNNPNWAGPWDCAEFTSWCAYQAYGRIYGAGTTRSLSEADPYSGYWYAEARKAGTAISRQEALKIPGAALIRAPGPGKTGHVAFAMGDNDRTLEARGAAYGVGIFDRAATRPWSIGWLLPGVEYETGETLPDAVATPAAATLPAGYLWLRRPFFKGAVVVALQRALARNGVDPGPIDGAFGPLTSAAVLSFQVMKGLEVDGVVGPNTAKALGLSYPIAPAAADDRDFKQIQSPRGPDVIPLPATPAAFDGIVGIAQTGTTFKATTASGFAFNFASIDDYIDDMWRLGLFQGKTAIRDTQQFGTYAADNFPGLGQWAYFIAPTLSAEGGARFATLNTYDRAAFTFGAPQLAAHTPRKNFIIYLRRLLALADAAKHFPELSLRKNAAGKTTVHLDTGEGFKDLEEEVRLVRPNGKPDVQLVHLMAYLNPSATQIDAAELSASARLINWLRLDPATKEIQISVFIDQCKENIRLAKKSISQFTGDD
ncbi:peptidoglycan-binding domain-containing protein [Roseixanthobacter liquoris]|uniref:peptidoglycan-binding domain-containing protein n=1 Tax=Roseixanthobacter liquoris TaxID=3119921 RepID=UPI00372A3FB4